MIRVLDDTLFDDPGRLADADVRGLLRAAALAGAQVRSTAEAISDAGLDGLADGRPRAVVLLARPGVGPAACRLLAALAGPRCPVPVLVTEVLPAWVGALDVVFAHAHDGGDQQLAEDVATAARRGASVVLAAPDEGPVAAAGEGRARLLPPRVSVPPELSFGYVLAAGLGVFGALNLVDADLGALADELDREAERAHLSHESLSNPAKTLALRLADRTPLLCGTDEPGAAVAGHAAFALAAHAAVAGQDTSYAQATKQPALHRAAASGGSEADLFADPGEGGAAYRVCLIAVGAGEAAERRVQAAERDFPGADLVAPADPVGNDPVARAAVVATRFDLASVYLGLAAGTLGGPGRSAMAMR
ncbi:hypothetical protein IQ251_18060 [Saccharopolyspora sp. HNM0983]|uniref:Phosphoglucose isomerase-like protein n=1 Tax=Saccharopolyspora montiporae TaxID=2781240 RepID=A0A929G1J2_9PSEU|nr:SIS domain-containing protein [Saccharopolyspora sp. HNM0983]MBE9376359.1 hypothetical protein [Saccharopolyspora sp. HNM0983]